MTFFFSCLSLPKTFLTMGPHQEELRLSRTSLRFKMDSGGKLGPFCGCALGWCLLVHPEAVSPFLSLISSPAHLLPSPSTAGSGPVMGWRECSPCGGGWAGVGRVFEGPLGVASGKSLLHRFEGSSAFFRGIINMGVNTADIGAGGLMFGFYQPQNSVLRGGQVPPADGGRAAPMGAPVTVSVYSANVDLKLLQPLTRLSRDAGLL